MTEKATGRRVTAADIARSIGVSRATVGFVLNDTPGQTISPATREKVLNAAAHLSYRPHLAARALASGRSKVVLLVLPDWPIEFSMSTHLEEASLALDEAGYSLVTWTPHPSGRARPLWETLQPDVVMGMTPFASEQVEAIRRSGAKVINPTDSDQPAEPLDFGNGPALQIRHLADGGHERIVFAIPTDTRLRGLSSERAALAARTAEDVGVSFQARPLDEESAQIAIETWLDAGATAVAAYNDDMAALAVGAALRLGRRIPEDLAVIGHDDAPIARLMVPALSTVHIDTAGLGRYVAELALHVAVDAPEPTAGPSTKATLIVRESS